MRQVRTQREREPARVTHILETPDGENHQDTDECEPVRITYKLDTPDQKTSQDTKEYELGRVTHQLDSPDGETSRDFERMCFAEGHALSGEPKQRGQSGHRMNVSQPGTPTNWRAQMKRQVRIWKEYQPVWGTHSLESPDGETV